ncbi:hypothetical protein VMCG_09064 [Cytospora schulzeri]|uniref:Uncharacterized protein n=1 Tax=Cytospora schulzeri TaxID=448051 RepID=A0A423VP52_9PEZI|nr:hypothetical protein VMCG_09064 [Valsa malicola]
MASLPAQHPRLALHLTDRALTPIISSSSTSSQQPPPQQQHNSSSRQKKSHTSYSSKRPTFSTSPPESPSDDGASSSPSSPSSSVTTTPQAEEALSSLSSTALSAYDAAKRLGKGAPLRTMVEYPDGGLVVLHSYMCPMSLALGTPGHNASSTSLHTTTTTAAAGHGAAHHEGATTTGNGNGNSDAAAATAMGERQARLGLGRPMTPTTTRPPLSSPMMMDLTDSDGEGEESPNAPPMLISTVVAPRAEDLREARRAAGRLERIARVFQTEWVVEGGGGGA